MNDGAKAFRKQFDAGMEQAAAEKADPALLLARVEAAEVWADEVARLIGRPVTDKVVRLRAKK